MILDIRDPSIVNELKYSFIDMVINLHSQGGSRRMR